MRVMATPKTPLWQRKSMRQKRVVSINGSHRPQRVPAVISTLSKSFAVAFAGAARGGRRYRRPAGREDRVWRVPACEAEADRAGSAGRYNLRLRLGRSQGEKTPMATFDFAQALAPGLPPPAAKWNGFA